MGDILIFFQFRAIILFSPAWYLLKIVSFAGVSPSARKILQTFFSLLLERLNMRKERRTVFLGQIFDIL